MREERDGLWTNSATRKRGTRLVAGQGSPRHRFWSSGNRRHHYCTRGSLVADPSPLTHTARRRPRCPDKRRQEERSFRNSWSNRGRHDNRCVAPRVQLKPAVDHCFAVPISDISPFHLSFL